MKKAFIVLGVTFFILIQLVMGFATYKQVWQAIEFSSKSIDEVKATCLPHVDRATVDWCIRLHGKNISDIY